MSHNSLAATSLVNTPTAIPPSFDGDPSLFAVNLFLMTAMFFLGLMMAGKQVRRLWRHRRDDHPLDPVSLYRVVLLLAGAAVALRCGAEAMLLWGWSPEDPVTTARVVMAKRWIDPLAVGCGLLWMAVVVLGEPGIEHQLRRAPVPIDMWSRWPALVRPAVTILLSFIAAFAAVVLR